MKHAALAALLLLGSCAGASRRGSIPPSPGPPSPGGPSSIGPARPSSRPAPSHTRFPYFLHLQGGGPPVPCRVKSWEEGRVVLEIPKNRFSLAARGESPGKTFPDVLLPKGGDRVLRCRILEEGGDHWTLVLPQGEIRGLLEGKGPLLPREGGEAAGGFEGLILWGNRPLAGARVRAVQITGRSLLPGILDAPPKLDRAVETRTDEKGRFLFQGLPPGNYKLWIQPPGRKEWIRRIRMIPDVRVLEGKTVKMKPFRVRRVIGG